MLIGKFREGLKSKLTQYFLFFMCLALVFGVSFFRVVQRIITGRTGQEVALVNKQSIDRTLFLMKKHEIQDQIAMLYRQFGAYTPLVLEQQGINPDPEKAALASLIQEELFDQVTRSFPITVGRDFVERKIYDPIFMYTRFPSMLPRQFITSEGKVDNQSYKAFIDSLQKGPFVKQVTHLLENQALTDIVGASTYVPQFFTNSLINQQLHEKQYDIYSISFDDVKKEVSKKDVDAGVLQKFYDQENKKNGRYTVPSKRSGTLWTFEPKNFAIVINDKELQDYYNKVKQSQFIQNPTEIKIREIIFDKVAEKGLKQLYQDAQEVEKLLQEHPEDFEKYARQYSTAKSASQGGLVKFFKRGTHEKALEQAAFRLKKDGDISPIVTLEKGYAIVQRVERKEVEYKPFESVKKDIYALLQQRKFSTIFTGQANRVIRSKSDSADQDYEKFLKEFGAIKSEIKPVEKQGSVVASRLFSLKKSGDKLAYAADGKGYILVLNDILKKSEIPFGMLQDTVKEDYYKQQAQKSLDIKVASLKKTLLKKEELNDGIVKKTKSSWIKNEKDEHFVVLQKEGISPEMLLLEKKGSVISGVTDKKGYVVVLVDTRKIDVSEDETNKLKKSIGNSIKNITQQSFIASLYRNATIEVLLDQAKNNNLGDVYDF